MSTTTPSTMDTNLFDSLAQTDDDGNPYWSARDLAAVTGYGSPNAWKNFMHIIDRGRSACANLGSDADTEFVLVNKVAVVGNLGEQRRVDYHLSRFAAYLVAMNGDPRKPQVAAAQAYFAVQTHYAEQHQAGERVQAPAPTGVPVHILEELTTVLSRVTDVLDRVTSTPTMATTVNVGSPAPVVAPEPENREQENRERGYWAQRRREAGVLSLREFCRDYLGNGGTRTMAAVMKYLETRGLVQAGGSAKARSITQRLHPTVEGSTFLTNYNGTTSVLEDAAAVLAVELRRSGVGAK